MVSRFLGVIEPMPVKNDTYFRHLKADEKDYKRSDGGGLFMLVTKTGSKLWRAAPIALTPSRSCSRSASIPSFRSRMPAPGGTMPRDCWLTALIRLLSARRNADKREIARSNTFEAVAKELMDKFEARATHQPR